MSAHARPPLAPVSAAAGAPTRSCAACCWPATLIALVPLVLVLYYLLKQGPRRVQLGLLHDRPDRRASSATRAASRARSSARSRSSRSPSLIAVPIGIGVALYLVEYGKDSRLRQRRPLLRRRDDRRAVDRLRPVHLHRAGAQRRRRQLRRLEGLGRARAADAAGRHALGRGRAATSCPTRCARRRSRSARRAGGSSSGSCCRPRCRASSPARCSRSPARAGETAPLLFTAFAVNATTFDLGAADELAARSRSSTTSGQAQDRLVERAWGAALTLVAMILLLTLVARLDPAKEPTRMSTGPTPRTTRPDEPSRSRPAPTPPRRARRRRAARRPAARRAGDGRTRRRSTALHAYYGDHARGQGRRRSTSRPTRSRR